MNDAIDIAALQNLGAIGQPLRRKEDQRLLTGKGRFSDDFILPGQAYAAIVRSPHPHARIGLIDMWPALAMPGVLGVFTGEDCVADGLAPIPHSPVPSTRYDMKLTGPGGGPIFIGPQMLLPSDKVRHVGEAVAIVVAETAAQAQDATEAVDRRIRGIAVDRANTGCACRRCAGGLGRGARQRSRRHLVRRRRGDRARLCGRRPNRRDGVPYRPRDRRPDRAARRPRPLGQRDRPLHPVGRQRRRGAAEGRTRRRPRGPARAGAGIVVRCRRQFRHAQPALRRSRRWSYGRRAGWAARSNTPRPGRKCSSATFRVAIC